MKMSLSEVVASIIEPLFDLMPQIHHRPASNQFGVVDGIWSKPKTFRGPLLHIPALTHVELYPSYEVPIDTGLQTLTSFCGKTVAVNATTILTVTDPILLRSVAGDEWQEYASMRIRGIVCDIITGHKWSQSLRQAAEFIEFDAAADLIECGIEVQQVVLEDMTETVPVRIFQ